MLLLDALRQAECSICLQSLSANRRSSASHTPNTTPQKAIKPSKSQPASSLMVSASSGLQQEQQQQQQQPVADSGFRILFAPGVQQAEGCIDVFERARGTGGDSLDVQDEESVVVLPCGHFLHFHCALQLYEYKENTACPICRQNLNSSTEFVVFRPQQRPRHFVPPASHTSDDAVEIVVKDPPDADDDISGDEVEVTGVRHGTAVEAYIHHLQREVDEFRRRRRTLRSREKHLTISKEHLEDQCLTFEQSLADAKRRYEVLSQSGSVGPERLMELRETARETNASLGLLTAELAALMRDQLTLDRQLEKYSRRLLECRDGNAVGVKKGSGNVGVERQLRKRHVEGSEKQPSRAYYALYE